MAQLKQPHAVFDTGLYLTSKDWLKIVGIVGLYTVVGVLLSWGMAFLFGGPTLGMIITLLLVLSAWTYGVYYLSKLDLKKPVDMLILRTLVLLLEGFLQCLFVFGEGARIMGLTSYSYRVMLDLMLVNLMLTTLPKQAGQFIDGLQSHSWQTLLSEKVLNKEGVAFEKVQYYTSLKKDEYKSLNASYASVLFRDVSAVVKWISLRIDMIRSVFLLALHGKLLYGAMAEMTLFAITIPHPLFLLPIATFLLSGPIQYVADKFNAWVQSSYAKAIDHAKLLLDQSINVIRDILLTTRGIEANERARKKAADAFLQAKGSQNKWQIVTFCLQAIGIAIHLAPFVCALVALKYGMIESMQLFFILVISWPTVHASLSVLVGSINHSIWDAAAHLKSFFKAQFVAQNADWCLPSKASEEKTGVITITLNDIDYFNRKYSNVNIHLRENKVTLLTGLNGVGKTTVFRLILGLGLDQSPRGGEVKIAGLDDFSNQIFALSQEPYRPNMPIDQYIQHHNVFSGLGAGARVYVNFAEVPGQFSFQVYSKTGLGSWKDLLGKVNLTAAQCQNARGEYKSTEHVSGGQACKLAFARLMFQIIKRYEDRHIMRGDRVLICLDESFKGIDLPSSHPILENLKKLCADLGLKSHILMVSHNIVSDDMDEVRLEQDDDHVVSVVAPSHTCA